MQKLIYVVFLFLIISCNVNEERRQNENEIEFKCFKKNDSTAYILLKNKSDKDIFIPGQYFGVYTLNDDSIHLEGFQNPRFDTTLFYQYNKLLPFKFSTTYKIKGVKEDTTIRIIEQQYFNQFRVLPFVKINKDSTVFLKANFDIPDNSLYATAVYYDKNFQLDSAYASGGYLFENFVEFEKRHAKHVVSPFIILYNSH